MKSLFERVLFYLLLWFLGCDFEVTEHHLRTTEPAEEFPF